MTDEHTESERIKDRLRACQSVESLNQVVEAEREAVRALAGLSEAGRTYAIQISNLKVWKLDRFAKEAQR